MVKRINPQTLWLVVIFALALTLRLAAVLMRDMIVDDEASMARMAEDLLAGRAPADIGGARTTELAILYPLIAAAFAVVVRDVIAAGYLVSILFGSLLVLPTYLLGKVFWGSRLGLAAAALVAVLPVLIDRGSLLDSSSVFAFFLLSAVFFAFRALAMKRCLCGLISGICLGLAFLAGSLALYYAVLLLIMLAVAAIRQKPSYFATKALMHFVPAFLLFAAPYVIFMIWQEEAFTLGGRPAEELYVHMNDLEDHPLRREMETMGIDDSGEIRLTAIEDGPGILATLMEEPGRFAGKTAHLGYRLLIRDVHSIVPVWLLPLAGLGLFKELWSRNEALKHGYLALVMIPLLVLPMVHLEQDRGFLATLLAIVMLWVARGWMFLEDWARETLSALKGPGGAQQSGLAKPLGRDNSLGEATSPKAKRFVLTTIITIVILVPLMTLGVWSVSRKYYPVELKEAGEWIAGLGDGSRVLSRESTTAWYAGGTQVLLPYAGIDDTLEYARRSQSDYLVVSRWVTHRLRPELEPLMDTGGPYGDRLEAVYHGGDGTGSELIIYKIK